MTRRHLLLLSLFALFSSVGRTAGLIYYVSTSGSDGVSCSAAQTIGTPKRTIVNALTCLGAGDTLLARGGNYTDVITSVPSGTSWANRVRLAAYASEVVWLKPTTATPGDAIVWLDCNCHYFEFDGINADGRLSNQDVLWTSTNNGNDPHHIRWQNAEVIAGVHLDGSTMRLGAHGLIGAQGGNELINLRIHGGGVPGLCGFSCASYGVYIQGPNNLVDRCDIYETYGAGIQLYGGAGDPARDIIIRNTKIHDISHAGDAREVWGILSAGNNNLFYNILIYNITIFGTGGAGDAAFAVGNGYSGNKFWNNTIFNVANTCIYVGTGSGHEVKNSICYMVGGSTFIDTASGTAVAGNLFSGNPLFVNSGAGDFKLQSTSPARNTGVTLAGVPTDLIGILRPQEGVYEIGAYEYLGGTPTGPPSPPTGVRIP